MLLLLYALTAVGTISNSWLTVSIAEETSTARAGSISYLKDHWTGTQIVSNGQFAGMNTGTFIPAAGTITVTSDTSLVFHTDHFTDGSASLPLDLEVTYTLVDRGLEMAFRLEYLEEIEFPDPLEIDFHVTEWDNLEISNQTAIDDSFPLNGSNGFQRFSGSQVFRLTGGLPDGLFILPNVSKGIIAVTDHSSSSYLTVRVLDSEAPRETATGPDLHSQIHRGQVDEYFIRFTLDEYFAPVFISGHPHGAEHSAGWIMDEIPFVHPYQGYIWGFSETADGDEVVSASLISFLDDHPQLKMNWLILPDGILTPNRDSVWFEPGWEHSWSHWHSTWRISTESTPEYRQWLRNIQDNVYPWADRITMGSHGYHHTPNADSSYGEFHEFITYEPWEHQERFRVHFLDLDDCGLDTNMVRAIRFPGHRTSLSGLRAVIDHGFSFYCNGWRLIDWYAGKQFRNQWITRYQTPRGRIWGSNTVWWGDYGEQQPYYYLSTVMDRGKFCLLGAHPMQMLWAPSGVVDPEAYARIDSLLYSLENDWSNFIWLFPEEYGDFLEDCFGIRVSSIRGVAPELRMSFTGAVPEGLTFSALLHPEDTVTDVTLNGVSLYWELRDQGRLFAVSPEMPHGEHVLSIGITAAGTGGSGSSGGFSVSARSPSFGESFGIATRGLSDGSVVNASVFDVSGRRMFVGESVVQGEFFILSPRQRLSPGIYFIMVTLGSESSVTKTVLLR